MRKKVSQTWRISETRHATSSMKGITPQNCVRNIFHSGVTYEANRGSGESGGETWVSVALRDTHEYDNETSTVTVTSLIAL